MLVVGSERDAHAAAVARALEERGIASIYLDFSDFPVNSRISWSPGGRAVFHPGSGEVDLHQLRSAYWRVADAVGLPEALDPAVHAWAGRESALALEGLLRDCRCPVVNSPGAIAAHRYKPEQSLAAAKVGAVLPATLVTNDPAAVHEFAGRHPEGVIVKPIGGGAYARRLTAGDPAREASIRACPMQYQAWVEGRDVRAYVFGAAVYAGRILTRDVDHVDFRTDPGHAIEAIRLGEVDEALCRRITRRLGLRFTAIDFRQRPDGSLVFLEANPSPMFLRFERDTGWPLLRGLLGLLGA